MRSGLATALAVGSAVVIAGCGGGSSGGTSSSQGRAAAGGAASVRPKIEAICARYNHAIAASATPIEGVGDVQAAANRRTPVEESMWRELRKLRVPASMAFEWQEFTAWRGSLARAVEAIGEEGLPGLFESVPFYTNAVRAQAEVVKAARSLGLEECTKAGEQRMLAELAPYRSKR